MKDENAKPSYTVQGERVPLERSRRFMAVEAAPEGEEALAALAQRLALAPAPCAMIDLPEQGICVVELAASDDSPAAGAEPAPFEALTEAIEAEPELTPGPAVYESPGDPDTALIAGRRADRQVPRRELGAHARATPLEVQGRAKARGLPGAGRRARDGGSRARSARDRQRARPRRRPSSTPSQALSSWASVRSQRTATPLWPSAAR